MTEDPRTSSQRFGLGVAVTVLAALIIFYLWMRPPLGDLGLMAAFLGLTAVISLLLTAAAYRLGWIQQSPRLRWTLLGGAALSSLLTFFNVWLTARLMFASLHDLRLATVLLLFAGGISLVFNYFFAETLIGRLLSLGGAARALAHGQWTARAAVAGRDELAELARTFNAMAAQLEAAARKQNELDALRRDLIAWVSHDLQTPLASMRAMVEALADGVVEDAPTQQRYLRTIQRDIQALSLLIDDLFQMAQLDAGGLTLERGPSALSDLISDTLESFSELAARQGVQLAGHAAPDVDPVTLDAPRIGRVLANLVGNALRYTPPGGQVEVRAERRADHVALTVRDTGEGIPAADLPHIFERFYRGEKSRSRVTGGAGLGLAIARGLVEAHGGQLLVDSQPGQGTTFTVKLPAP